VALFLQIGLATLVASALWIALRPRGAFVIRIKGGVPRVARGTVTRGFLTEVGETCERHRVRRGVIRGESRGRRIVLGFSGGIPAGCQQQLRNLWALSG